MQSQKTIDLLSIGNTIVDMEYNISDERLHSLGVEKGAMMLIDAARKNELIEELGPKVHLCNGGSVANSLFVAHHMGLTGHHHGVVGNDDLGTFVMDDYQNQGISASFSDTMVSGDTGCCLILITPDGERSMLTYLGVSSQFSASTDLTPLVQASRSVFLEGYLVADDACFDTILLPILSTAAAHATSIILTLSDAGLASFFSKRFNNLLNAHIDILFCNHQEALALSGEKTIPNAQTFFEPTVNETVITDGPHGAYIFHKSTSYHVPTSAIQPTDTTGAGDAFAGAYITKRLKGHPIELSATTAHDAARHVISNYGARPSALVDYLKSDAIPHF